MYYDYIMHNVLCIIVNKMSNSGNSLYINNTGIREGERIIGVGKQCKGSIIQVVSSLYPPCRIFASNSLLIRDVFPSYSYFSSMTPEEIVQYIMQNGIDNKDLYMDDVSTLIVKFEILSGEYFSKYPDICNTLIGYGPINIKDAFNMFPKNPGSKARKHTLVFRPTNWTLMESTENKDYSACIDVFKGIDITHNMNNNAKPTYVIDGVGYIIDKGISLSSNNINTTRPKMKELSWYPPSLLKSLIQKIIRVKPTHVIFPGNITYPALYVLHSAITTLLEHPGSFVPNIQRFVKGTESCFKRVAVSIVEDSYIERSHDIYILLINALILQREASYIPSKESIDLLYYCSEEALNSPYCYVTSTNKNDNALTIYACDLSWFPICSDILNTIGSFESDIRMFREYVGYTTYIHANEYTKEQYIPMNVWHCVDHHCYTDIAWFCNVQEYKNYEELFRDIWELSSKYNPRRGLNTTYPFNDAQRECYLFHMPHIITYDKGDINNMSIGNHDRENSYRIRISYVLHEDYLYSLIGTMYYSTSGQNYIITRLGSSIARKPRREDPDYVKKPITDIERQHVLQYVSEELRKGIKRSLPAYSNIVISTDNTNRLTIEWNGILYRWNDLRRITLDLIEGYDIDKDYNLFIQEVKNMDPRIRKRLYMYCSTWRDEISIHRIGRDGKGTKYAVSTLDSYVFRIFMKMSKIFPTTLDISEGKIKITNQVIFWYIRDKLLFHHSERGNITDNTGDTIYNVSQQWYDNIHINYNDKPIDTRTLYPYQRECVDKLINAKTPGSILWIDVGMGKTLIVLTYIKYLIDNGLMTSYCCYTLPPSALDSIVKEMQLAGINYNILDMRKSNTNRIGGNILLPYHINILYHDHLKMGTIADQLRNISDDLTLVVDEFHLCLSSTTIRTSLTLEIAKLSNRFIAMSGTILNSIDAIDDMIEWLELTVPYPLNKNNYQVAISELISFETDLKGIEVLKKGIECIMTKEQLDEYKKFVPPSIGGTSNRLYLQEALKSCYDIVLPQMAQYAKSLISSYSIGSLKSYSTTTSLGVYPPKPIFIVVQNKEQQDRMEQYLSGYVVHKIGINNPITLKPEDNTNIQFIITTMNYNAGYTLTKCDTMLTSVYPSNEASRTQIEGRLYRLGQTSDVKIITFHTGILSYIMEKHIKTGNMNKVLKELSSM